MCHLELGTPQQKQAPCALPSGTWRAVGVYICICDLDSLGLTWIHLDSLGVFGSAEFVVVNSVPLFLGPSKLSLCLALISGVQQAIGLHICVHRRSDASSGMPACVNAGAKPAILMELALVIQPVAEATHARGIVGHGSAANGC